MALEFWILESGHIMGKQFVSQCLFTEKFSHMSTIHPGIFLKRVLFKQYSVDVLETNMLGDFQGATIGPIVLRHKHSIVFIVYH